MEYLKLFRLAALTCIVTSSATIAQDCVPLWGQCGGIGYSGLTNCCPESNTDNVVRHECKFFSEYFHQCQIAPEKNYKYTEECNFDEGLLKEGVVDQQKFGPSFHGKLSVQGTQLIDQNGDQVQLQGVSSHGIQYFPECYRRESFQVLKESWNINLFRIAMYVAPEERGYAQNKTLIQTVDEIVDLCVEFDVYCIIDWHVLMHGAPLYWITEPGVSQANATDFWVQIAQKHKDKQNLIYELINEPNAAGSDETQQWEEIKIYAEEVILAIRSIDPDSVILLGAANFAQRLDLISDSPLSTDLIHNLMYTFHFYAGTHEYLLPMLDEQTDVLPVFISEWGLSDYSGDGGLFLSQAKDFFSIVNEKRLSWATWSFSVEETSTGMLLPGSCYQAEFEYLTCSGVLIKNLLRTGSFASVL